MRKFEFTHEGLSTREHGYGCSTKQLKAIFSRTRKSYKQDIGPGGDMQRYQVIWHTDGSVEIGCMNFSKRDVAQVQRWLKGRK